MHSYSKILTKSAKYPVGTEIKPGCLIVARCHQFRGSFDIMIVRNEPQLPDHIVSNDKPSRFCAYFRYPQKHSCANYSSDQWNTLASSADIKIIYNRKQTIGVIFDRGAETVEDINQIAKKITSLITSIDTI